MSNVDSVFVGSSGQAVSGPISSSALHQDVNESVLQKANEQMYKQNFELAMRNKTLSTLRSLYSVTMQSIYISEVSQNIVRTIVETLLFESVFLFIHYDGSSVIRLVAASHKFDQNQAIPIRHRMLDIASMQNSCVKSFSTGLPITSNDIHEAELKDLYSQFRTETWQSVTYYPLVKQQHSLGVLGIAYAKKKEDLSQAEQNTVEEILQLVTLAIDRAQLYESVQRTNAQLQDLDKLKDEFVSLASHELRTPMAAIKGSLSTILEGYAGPISDQTREFLTAAYNENDRLIRLVNNLLNTSRIESGRLSFALTRVNLPDLITDVTKNLQIAAKEKNIYLRYEASGLLPQVLVDEDKIKEVIINLIGNALKFTSEGGITIKTEVKENMVLTSVADTGTGIHKEDFDLLFKKFSQVKRDQKYTKTYGGTGLGLYLSQKIIEGLGGKIWLDSEVGKGTTFYFTLPIA